MRFIGDIHGKWIQYEKVIKDAEQSVQIGDFGMGMPFIWEHVEAAAYTQVNNAMDAGHHRFIRGNHDSPIMCEGNNRWIEDGLVEDGVMYVGGAHSIDSQWRTRDYDWWEDEELSYLELGDMIAKYDDIKPKVMVTHDAPDIIAQQLFRYNKAYPSRTRTAFETMFEIHKPEMWIFGHWHRSRKTTILGTEFICLAELEAMDLDLNTLNVTFPELD